MNSLKVFCEPFSKGRSNVRSLDNPRRKRERTISFMRDTDPKNAYFLVECFFSIKGVRKKTKQKRWEKIFQEEIIFHGPRRKRDLLASRGAETLRAAAMLVELMAQTRRDREKKRRNMRNTVIFGGRSLFIHAVCVCGPFRRCTRSGGSYDGPFRFPGTTHGETWKKPQIIEE